VWGLLDARASLFADRIAVHWHPFANESSSWTYGELHARAASIAAGLSRRGIQAGDRVVIHLDNCPDFVATWFACAAIGAIAVTTNTRSATDEMKYYVEHSGACAAITQPKFADLVGAVMPHDAWLAVTDNDAGEPVANGSLPDRASTFRELLDDPNNLVTYPADPLEPMSVQYTSGTTSRPKGVLWTHANALWGARVNSAHEGLRSDDCQMVYMPLFHTNALAYSMLASMWVGARFVLLPKWSTSRFHAISLKYGCTWLPLMGLSARSITDDGLPDGHCFRAFGFVVCDAPWDEALGVKTLGWWGMTETITHGIVGDPYAPNRPWSMGRPAPEYEIAVVDDDGRRTPDDEAGNLLVKGTPGVSLFAEYLHDPEATAASFDEHGWFRTGDVVRPHSDGHISFVERAKDMLKVGAENVAASEIERVLLSVPGVAEAAVVGRPDVKLDEVPVAFLIASDGDDLERRALEECAAKLADFKVPRQVYIVREFPRSTLRKVNKSELRRAAASDEDPTASQMRWRAASVGDPSGDAD
jgi:crotonobetaine/carnitine-CoA ligase